MQFLADSLYGPAARPQPNPTLAQATAAGAVPPEEHRGTSHARTKPRHSGPGANPTLWLVALLGLAILLVHVSVRASLEVSA
jgi:hypothetical protein